MSIIIPVYNEERFIYNKLINVNQCLKYIDIPFEVLIGSDGSSDSSCQIIKDFIMRNELVHWHIFEFQNEGKCQTINKLVKLSVGDLIISTDADVTMNEEAIQIIIDTFVYDKNLGCISSIPVLQSGDLKFQSIYWGYEIKLRDSESQVGMLIVSTGGLYAYRKPLFEEIPHGVMADDLWIPLNILLKNYKSAHRTDLKLTLEETDEKTEAIRRKRVVSGGIDVVKRLNFTLIKKPLLFFIVFSHKINRWLLPLWVVLLAIGTVLLSIYFLFAYVILLIVMIILFSPSKLFYLIYTIISPIFSLKNLLFTKDISKWDHIRK